MERRHATRNKQKDVWQLTNDEKEIINVDANARDRIVSLGKGLAGLAPVVGPLVAEVVDNLIPNQRIDRISRLVKALEARLEQVEKAKIDDAFQDEEFIDLLEDGFFQAARARSQERIERIATLLDRSITDEEITYLHTKRLLQLLGEITDEEIIILLSYSEEKGRDEAFRERHAGILEGPHLHMGSSQDEIDRDTIHRTHRQNLVRHGLLQPRFKKPKKGESPELDHKTGMMKANGQKLTPLGRLLLRQLELIKEF